MAQDGGEHVSIFGSRNRRYTFFDSTVIRRVQNNIGMLSTHFEIIQNTLILGLNPLFFKGGTFHKLFIHEGKIWATFLNDVSSELLSKENSLITFETSHFYCNGFSFFTFSPNTGTDLNSFDWFPRSNFEMWQRECTTCYYFNDENSGFTFSKGKVIGLRNQNSQGGKFSALSRSKDYFLSKLPDPDIDHYSLNVRDTTFTIKKIDIATWTDMICVITLGFQVAKPTKNKQILISSPCLFRSVYILGDTLHVIGAVADETITAKILINEYNFLFLLFDNSGSGFLQVNENAQHFKTRHVAKPSKQEIYLFGKIDSSTSCFNGQISMLHIFQKKGLPRSGFPAELRQTIFQQYTDLIS